MNLSAGQVPKHGVRSRLISVTPLDSSPRLNVEAPSTSNIVAKRLMSACPRLGTDFPQGTRTKTGFLRRDVWSPDAASRTGLLPTPGGRTRSAHSRSGEAEDEPSPSRGSRVRQAACPEDQRR